MNERIRELSKQAGGNPNYKAFRGYFLPPPPDYIDPATVNLEKFAELIVQECVGIVDKIVPPGYNDYPDYRDQIEQAFRRECATEIKKHFGVEE